MVVVVAVVEVLVVVEVVVVVRVVVVVLIGLVVVTAARANRSRLLVVQIVVADTG